MERCRHVPTQSCRIITEQRGRQQLAAAARLAEEVDASVTLPPGLHFVRTRSMVRGALLADGVAQKVEALVVTLLAGTGLPD
jgi:hypothetical protein